MKEKRNDWKRKRKTKFWENDVDEKWTEIVNSEVKERKRSGRYGTKTRYEDNKKTNFFFEPEVVSLYLTPLSVQFFKFWSIFAISWLRNGNPVNWTVLSLKVRFINIRYWFSKFFDLPQNWPKIFKIEQYSIMCSLFFLISEVNFLLCSHNGPICLNFPTFDQKIFKIDVFFS